MFQKSTLTIYPHTQGEPTQMDAIRELFMHAKYPKVTVPDKSKHADVPCLHPKIDVVGSSTPMTLSPGSAVTENGWVDVCN